MFYDRYEHLNLLWWTDLGWLPDAHPAALSLPLLNRTRRRKLDGKAHGLR